MDRGHKGPGGLGVEKYFDFGQIQSGLQAKAKKIPKTSRTAFG